jgi:hypothetical protein
MRRIKRPKLGQYYLLSWYKDHRLDDPWCIGSVAFIMEDINGMYYKIEHGNRWYRYCFKISKLEADERKIEFEKRRTFLS